MGTISDESRNGVFNRTSFSNAAAYRPHYICAPVHFRYVSAHMALGMSVHVTSIIWRHYPNRGELLTALALADIADDRGYCIYADTSIEIIADKTLQSPRSVQYHLQAMKAIGWLVVVGNETGGRGLATQYRIPVDLVPLGGAAQRVQDLRPYENRQTTLDGNAQDVVDSALKRAQTVHPSSDAGKGADPAVKGAIHDAKGCNLEQPLTRGTSVHKKHVTPAGAAPPGALPVFLEIPLVAKGQTHAITEAKVAEWQESYPGIDVKQSLRTIRQWNIDNPANRKTARGIEAHISRWLAKDQNSARPGQVPAAKKPEPLTCKTRDPRGEVCSMPAKKRPGDIDECDGCFEKRIAARGMPKDVRERLGLEKRTPA
jgi:hypothetical protein